MLLNFFKQYFVLDDTDNDSHHSSRFRISALRILLSVSLLAILGFTSSSLIEFDASDESVLFVSLGILYTLIVALLLIVSRRFHEFAAIALASLIAVTGALFIGFSNTNDGVEFGVIALYSLPLIVRLFYSFKASLCFSIANIATLGIDLYLAQSQDFKTGSGTLYMQLMLFALLNFGLPLSVSRLLKTLQMSIDSHKELADLYLKKSDTINGIKVIPVDSKNKKLFQEFCRKIIKKTPKQLHAYWIKEIFRGDKQPPKRLSLKELKSAMKSKTPIISYDKMPKEGQILLTIK